jgi:DNA-binding NarL/FixJ family response regulator
LWAGKLASLKKIRVAILDDHPSIIDGYIFRLGKADDIEVVATALFVDELENILKSKKTDVLILDVFVPSSKYNSNPYPILQAIPKWKALYPELIILVISMYNLRTLIAAVMESGASGYILKDDQASIHKLDNVIRIVAGGGVYFSKPVYEILHKQSSSSLELTARQMQALSICAANPDSTTSKLANLMNVEHSTFRNLLSGAYERLGVHNRTAAITKAIQLGLIPSPNIQTDL